ncbi:mitochondrial thiamine pyrophosphate carrier-like [Babylonia areolata]|uniref:mitochondrial thiamine pyrophosphate carrier-like n=1 Tax=Babylonia areolata TaxID=304850 RepID=UPI003FD0F9E6
MVGFSPHESIRLSKSEYAAAGAISGSLTRCVSQPLDVVKIRFQLQVEPIAKGHNSKYTSVGQAIFSIVREEGWRALWKGHIPAQVLSITHGTVQFSSFEIFTKTAWYFLPEKLTTSNWRPVTHTVCGSLSGCVAVFIVHPIDVMRTRLVAQGEPKIYTSLGDAYRKILMKEGVMGFYKGLIPSLMQIAPQRGLQFGFYSLFTGLWNKTKGVWFDSAPGYTESLLCGSSAGVASKFIVFPLDVAKKRLQVQGFESARQKFGVTQQYSGMASCLVQVARDQGLRGLYKGLTPGLLKSALMAGCNFSVYEEVCHLMAVLRARW